MSRFKQVIKKKELESALSKHPLREIDEQVKSDYVKGLVFVATEDGNFHEEEKNYVVSLMKNIGLDENLLEEFEAFSSGCQEEELLAFMDRLKGFQEDIKLNFLIEVVVIAFRDGEFDEKEQGMFDDYLEMLGLANQKDDIMYMALALVNKDIDLALSLYTAKKEFFNKFDYMFDMLDIDIEKELHSVYSWEWTVWEANGLCRMRENRSVSLVAENVQKFSIFLNSKIISGEFERRNGTNLFFHDGIQILDDNTINNLLLMGNGLYNYAYEGHEGNNLILLNKGTTRNIIDIYVIWLQHNVNKDIRPMEVHVYSVDGNVQISFKSDCAGKPAESIYEWCFGSRTHKKSNESIFDDMVFYNNDSFGATLYYWDRMASPTEFTFRLMKVEE